VLIIDTRGDILYCNPATESLFGYSKKQLLSKNVKMLMTNKDSRQHSDYLSRYVDTGIAQIIGNATSKYPLTFPGKGRIVDCKDSAGVEFKARLTVNETKGSRHYFTGTLHKLDVNDDAYRNVDISTFIILDGFMDAMVVIDTMGIIQFVNKAAEELVGVSRKAAIGLNVKVLMPEPFRSEHDIYLSNYRRSGISKIMNNPAGRGNVTRNYFCLQRRSTCDASGWNYNIAKCDSCD
jgi:two-component system sensor kinase FixL